MQPSKHSYNTVGTSKGVLGGSYGWYYYALSLQNPPFSVQLYSSNDGDSTVTSHSTTTPCTSWLGSRKMKWIVHELSQGLLDLHAAAVQQFHLHNLHLWKCLIFIKGNHSTNKQACVVLLMKNGNELPISAHCQCKCKSIRYAAITVTSPRTFPTAPSIICRDPGAWKRTKCFQAVLMYILLTCTSKSHRI